MTAQKDLVERVRDALRARNPREVSMFGGVSFMVEDRMVVAVGDGGIAVRRGEGEGCDVVVRASPPAVVAAAVYGKVPLEALEGEGAMSIEGDRKVFERFIDFFHLPQKAG